MAKTQTVEFNQEVKHSGKEPGAPLHRFFEGQVVAFEDVDAAQYFVKVGWASKSTKDPQLTVSKEELDIDPETRDNKTGLLVEDVATTTSSKMEG